MRIIEPAVRGGSLQKPVVCSRYVVGEKPDTPCIVILCQLITNYAAVVTQCNFSIPLHPPSQHIC